MDSNLVFQLPQGLGLGVVLLIIIIVIVVDALFGVLQSLKDNTFDRGKLLQFIKSDVLPYVGVVLVLAMAAYMVNAETIPVFYALFYAVAMIIVGKYGADIVKKLLTLFGIKKFPT